MQRAAATRALELDDTLAEAHASLAHIYLFRDLNWSRAEAEFRQAVDLNPNYASAHQWYALHLASMGRHNEALAEIKRAQDIDPLSLIINHNMGFVFYLARRYDEALEQFRKTLDLDPNYYDTYFGLGITYGQKGMYKEALANLGKAVSLSATETDSGAALAYFYSASGQRAEAQKILDAFNQIATHEPIPSHYFALIHTGLGDKDKAITALEGAVEKHWYAVVYLEQEPMFDPLRSEPRFKELLRRLNLNL